MTDDQDDLFAKLNNQPPKKADEERIIAPDLNTPELSAAELAAKDIHIPEAPLAPPQKKELLDGKYMRRPATVRIGQRRNKFYTKFVRSMRVVLPLIAMGVVVVLIVLSGDNADIIKTLPQKDEVVKQTSIGKNELLEPRFDTSDKEGRPYAITAARAFQTMESSDIIYLEKPVADSTMKDGTWVALEGVAGTYNQIKQTLLLEGNVKLYHDAGYTLLTDVLNIDLETNIARSEVDVSAHGPIGTLESKGMVADGVKNILIFKGPAKVVLHNMDSMLE
jgi:lipopolysaccharide export system protein LptC|tara:strand:+ start:151444 stop:152277 length:834 start_codon:yes stop_codon:yes gene_type:complete